MTRFTHSATKRRWMPAVLAVVALTVLGGGVSATGTAVASTPVLSVQPVVELGTAATFAILSETGVTDVPASAVNGNVGASPITGAAIHLTCPEVQTGLVYTVDAAGPACKTTDATFLNTVVGDMGIAYANSAERNQPDQIDLGAGEIGGLSLLPGLYKWNTGVTINSDVTLSGGPNDVYVMQIAGNLSEASAKQVTLIGGLQAKNVFWQTAGAASIGTTAHFEGTILAKSLIAMKTGASINGRRPT